MEKILKQLKFLKSRTKQIVSSGKNVVLFWEDSWKTAQPLKELYPKIWRKSSKKGKVIHRMVNKNELQTPS